MLLIMTMFSLCSGKTGEFYRNVNVFFLCLTSSLFFFFFFITDGPFSKTMWHFLASKLEVFMMFFLVLSTCIDWHCSL